MGLKLRLLVALFLALPLTAISQLHPSYAAGTQVQNCTFATLQSDLQGGGDWYYAPGQCSAPIVFPATNGVIDIGNNTNNVTATLTAQGNDVTLDGANQTSLFFVGGGSSFSLDGFTVTGGNAGAITSQGALSVNDSTFTNNTSTGRGGAILITDSPGAGSGSPDVISNSTFEGNSAAGPGGAISGEDSTVYIDNSTFTNNSYTGTNFGGGAIATGVNMTIIDSTIAGNSVSGTGAAGGGIWVDTKLTIGGTILSTNTGGNCALSTNPGTITDEGYNLADDAGTSCSFSSSNKDVIGQDPQLGPLANNGGPTQTMALPLSSPAIGAGNCALTDASGNTITTDQRGLARPDVANLEFCDVGAFEYTQVDTCPANEQVLAGDIGQLPSGGTLALSCSTPTSIYFDQTDGGYGSPITIAGGRNITLDASNSPAPITLEANNVTQFFHVANGATLKVNGLTFADGYDPTGGGAIWSDGTLTVTNSTFSENTSPYGGAINIDGGKATISGSTFANNTATGSSTASAGAVYVNNATVYISNSTFTGNAATDGNGTAVAGGVIFSDGTVTIVDSTLDGNDASGQSGTSGGAIFVNSNTVTIGGSIIADNRVVNGGNNTQGNCASFGTIADGGGNLESGTDCGLSSGLQNTEPNLGQLGSNGGPTQTMALPSGSPAIGHGSCVLKDAGGQTITADQRGDPRPAPGTSYCDPGAFEYQPVNTCPTTENALASAITALGSGGTLTFDCASQTTIHFDQNGGGNGGPIAVTAGQNVTLDASASPKPVILDGGNQTQLFTVASGASLTLNSLTLTNANSGPNAIGGAINSLGTLTVDNSTFTNDTTSGVGPNQTPSSGSSGGAIYSEGTLSVTNSTFTGNSSTNSLGSGGAIATTGLTTILDSTFTNNSANGDGGAVNGNNTPGIGASVFTGDTFSGNQATNLGGALAFGSNNGATITNSTFDGNWTPSTGDGSAIYTFTGVDLSYDTIAGNTGSPALGGALSIIGTILDNTVNCAGNVAVTDDGANLTYNVAQQAAADAAGVCGTTPLVNGDPKLGSLANNGGPTQTMALLAGSPAIHVTGSCTDVFENAVTTDQRGLPRPQGKGCSIGAFEPQLVPTLTTPVDNGYINPKAPDGVLSWSAVTDPSGPVTYSVQYVLAGGTPANPTCDFSTSPTEADGITGTSYTFPSGIADGIYCWRVQAVNGANVASGYSAARIVTLDTTLPTSRILFPVPGDTLDATGWYNGCDSVGIPVSYAICGSAEDLGSGVAGVLVAIQDKTSGNYWNGSTCTWQSDPFYNYAISGGASTYTGGVTPSSNPSALPASAGGGGSSLIGGGSSLIGGGSSLIGGGSSLIGLPTGGFSGFTPASNTGTICNLAAASTGGTTSTASGPASGGGSSLIGGGSSLIGGGSSLIGGGSSLIGGGSSLIGGGSSLIGGGSSLIGGNETAVKWYYPVDMPSNGNYQITAEAVDGTGNIEPATSDSVNTAQTEHPGISMLLDGASQSGAVNVAPDASIFPTFSEPMYPASMNNITLTQQGGGSVPLTIDCTNDHSGNCETPKITHPMLSANTTYTLTIPATGPSNGACVQNNLEYCVVDQGLNPLNGTYTFTFTTGADALPADTGDADNDGIPNSWDGGTISLANGNSINTGAWDFSPTHRDLCVVEYYMNGTAGDGNSYNQAISQAANQDIVNAFASAPEQNNPDGKKGIHAVIFEANNNLQTSGSLTSSSAGNSAGLPSGYSGPYYGGQVPMQDPFGLGISNGNFDWTAFDQIANQYFVPTGLAQVCHMALIVHTLNGSLATGTSRGLGASDFIVALGTVPGGVGTEQQQAGTVMHELGHNLDLRHGGGDDTNFKPNYMSVMNYNYQFRGVPENGVPLGLTYSSGTMPTLDKGSLNDQIGLGAAASGFGARYWCFNSATLSYQSEVVANADGPINWGCLTSGALPSTTLDQAPINQEPYGQDQSLSDYNDWLNLQLAGDGTIGYGAVLPGTAAPTTSTIDITPNENGGPDTVQSALNSTSSYGSLVVLDPSAAGAVSISGNGCVSSTLQIDVASNSSSAISTSGTCSSGKSLSSATGIASNGGATTGCCSPAISALPFPLSDPLAGTIPLPTYSSSGGWSYMTTSVTSSGGTSTSTTAPTKIPAGNYNSGTHTYSPGVYSGGISVSGNTKATLSPGVYVLDGGGLSVSGNASLTGNGVFIYNSAGTGRCGSVSLSGNAKVSLSAPTSGPFTGAVLDQAARCSTTATISGSANFAESGTFDLSGATLQVTGNGQYNGAGAQLVVDTMTVSGNGKDKLN